MRSYYITANPPDFGDGDSVLTMFYEAYTDSNGMDDDTIEEDFNKLYLLMNSITLSQMDTLTVNYTERQLQHLVDIFVACSRYELAFWEIS